MRKTTYRRLLILAILLWTTLVLYGSLASGDDLPSLGWLGRIPYFDKFVHFVFYAVEASLLIMLFDLRGWRKLRIWLLVVVASALVEYLQGAFFARSSDPWDLLANTLGACFALWLAPRIERWITAIVKIRVETDRKTAD